MDEKLPVTAQTPREDSFDTAVRGYNRQQVMEYMARSSQLLTTLEQHLAVARADAQRARADAERAQAEAEHLRSQQVETKPVHEEVSGRLSQILRLAAEEADQERATADEEIATLRAESQAETERLIGEARAEAERQVAEARDIAERELAEARDTAERELAEARDTADEELRAAREEAERLRSTSEEQSAHLIDDAQRRAGAVNEVSDQRLETLTATHGEAVLRLGQIRDVLADLLDRDAAAGSLAEVVEAVMAPPGSVRPELDTPAELEGTPVELEDPDQTSIVPAVDQTAEHEPIEAEVITADELEDGATDADRPERHDTAELPDLPVPTGTVPTGAETRPEGRPDAQPESRPDPQADTQIDLRDRPRTEAGERGVPSHR